MGLVRRTALQSAAWTPCQELAQRGPVEGARTAARSSRSVRRRPSAPAASEVEKPETSPTSSRAPPPGTFLISSSQPASPPQPSVPYFVPYFGWYGTDPAGLAGPRTPYYQGKQYHPDPAERLSGYSLAVRRKFDSCQGRQRNPCSEAQTARHQASRGPRTGFVRYSA